ncbi:MAG: RHS repeat protein [Candidatus Obscuribacter sp.]|nr:RHS repeat protein [Candidatus Obscuribacter sp.]
MNLTTSMTYDAIGNCDSITDPNSNTTTFVFDDERRLIQRTEPSPLSYVTNITYDANGNQLTIERQTGGSPSWQIYSWTYSASDKMLTETDPASNTTTWTYDSGDQIQTKTDAESRQWQFGYDALNRVNQVTDPSSTVCDIKMFTDNGKLESIEDARGNVTQYTWDGFDRAEQTIFADTTFELNSLYDANGNVLTKLTSSGDSVVMTYDALNRLETKSPTSQPVITNTYDLAGRLIQASKPTVTGDPSSGAIDFAYDTAGRFISETYPDGKVVSQRP